MITKVRENIKSAIFGKDEVIELMLLTLISGGHVLLEDIPGVGKTTMAKALAKSMDMDFSRIQFTPDMLPSDVMGVSIFNQKTNEFEIRTGPVFSQIVLADEINRASPKTQSSMLEVMAERQVTIDGTTQKVKEPFMVIATQNPIEFEGTFPLPEAQLDRFMMRLSIGYPSRELEIRLFDEKVEPESLSPVMTKEEVLGMISETEKVEVSDKVRRYIVDIADHMRRSDEVLLPPSPRATMDLFKAARAYAYLKGRTYATPDDVKKLAPHVFSHRVEVSSEVRFTGISNFEYVEKVAGKVNIRMDE